jgi:hypothetical protein
LCAQSTIVATMFYERRADRLYQLAVRTAHGVVTADIDADGVGTVRAVYDATDTTASYDLLPDWDASVPPAREAPETRAVWETWLRSPVELRDTYGLSLSVRVSQYGNNRTAAHVLDTLCEAGIAHTTHLWVCTPGPANPAHYDRRSNRLCTTIAFWTTRSVRRWEKQALLAAWLTRLPSEVAELIWREYIVAPERKCTLCDAFRDLA